MVPIIVHIPAWDRGAGHYYYFFLMVCLCLVLNIFLFPTKSIIFIIGAANAPHFAYKRRAQCRANKISCRFYIELILLVLLRGESLLPLYSVDVTREGDDILHSTLTLTAHSQSKYQDLDSKV